MLRYRIVTEWSDQDECYIARAPAFPGLAAHGDSAAEAAREAEVAAKGMLAVLRGQRQTPPPPDVAADYSGNIRLRIPRALHRRLVQEAAAEGVSLNLLMVEKLAGTGRPADAPRGRRPLSKRRLAG